MLRSGRLLLFFSLLVAIGFAQDASTGAIRGVVSDSSSSRIPNASVAFVNNATGFRYLATTDADGRFSLDLLTPGEYSGRVEAQGMSPQLAEPLHVEVGGAVVVEFKLAIAGVKETVTVSEEPPLVETQPSAVSAVVDERAIQDLPLNGRRFTDLALLTPGVTQDPRGLTSSSNGDLAFGGIADFSPVIWWTGLTTITRFFRRPAGGIARRISFPMKWCRSFEFPRILMARNLDAPAELW